jgi:hypothetical protein
MGLDQFAYCRANKEGTWDESREIAYWRKHPNLQGWMEQLWAKRNPDYNPEGNNMFNGVELELSWEDLNDLEQAVINDQLPQTKGFFFGEDSDDYYKQSVLEFVRNARAELFLGLKVFYNSSW